jgi:hypothetical protein
MDELKKQHEAKVQADKDAIHLRNVILPATIAGVVALCIFLILIVLNWGGV